jgi:Alpha/beta hydrolase domain
VLWVGWQWDVMRRPGVAGLDVPDALDADGRPIQGQARLGFQPVVDTPRRRLADLVPPPMGQFRALPVVAIDDPTAKLTERNWFNDVPRIVDRSRWHFVDHEHIELDGGFRGRRHYELTYTTSSCPVTGVGLAAVRDVVGHVRPGFTHTLALGVSQSGRWLRQFIFDTANAGEHGEAVFDGVHCHIAGGRRGEFNHRYAQPSTMNPLGFTHLPPFSPEDGLLDRCRAAGVAPKIVFTNTATEYWRGDASLSHPEPDDPGCRWYLYGGAHHSGQMPGHTESLPVQLAANLVDITWLTRAHLAALDRWVADGIEPPPSAVPRPDDGTAATREIVLASLPGLDDFTPPTPAALLGMPPIDLGPDSECGVGRFPPEVTGPARPCYVSAVDDDGNEVAGIRLPHLAVPLDASFGWNPERPRDGVPVEVWNLLGGRVAFTPDEVIRRYGDRHSYLDQVRASAAALVTARHLLEEDVEAVLADAARRWDALLAAAGSA